MLKLNLGCGRHKKEGYINIDIKDSKGCEPDVLADCRNLPYKKNTIDVIESYHLIEHLTKQEAIEAVQHWYNLLKPGGTLIIECPNILGICKKFVEGNVNRFNEIYGLQRNPYDFHKFGYTPTSLLNLLVKVGFKKVWEAEPTDYHAEPGSDSCLRMEALK